MNSAMRSLAIFIVCAVFVSLAACSHAEKKRQKMAERFNCDPDEMKIFETSSSPWHRSYTVECRGQIYDCTDTTYYKNCKPRVISATPPAVKN